MLDLSTPTPPAWDRFCSRRSAFASERIRVIARNSETIKFVLSTDAGGKLGLQSPIYFAVDWQNRPATKGGVGTVSGGIEGRRSDCDTDVIMEKRHFVQVSYRR